MSNKLIFLLNPISDEQILAAGRCVISNNSTSEALEILNMLGIKNDLLRLRKGRRQKTEA
jgi:hypothetical protein